ncbi:MAG TPA: hypothetical protein VIY47_08790 [Ignavibacteriaceae bacterium]
MKYLPLYYKWMEKGEIPYRENEKTCGGLCSIFEGKRLFELITPNGGNNPNDTSWYWGYSEDYTSYSPDLGYKDTAFTPLRQTIVLFLAAMNNEL